MRKRAIWIKMLDKNSMPKTLTARFVFFGNPPLALPVLDELEKSGISPALLVTMPDPKERRGSDTTIAITKEWADKKGIDCIQPESIDDEILHDALCNSEWDVFVIASYGHIIPAYILDMPKYGALNIHPSLLPKYRGASPVRSIILDDNKNAIGVTIIKMDEKMDHGPIIAQASVQLEEWPQTALLLEELLAREGGKLLAEVLQQWIGGKIEPEEQEHDKASYTKKIIKEDGLIDLSEGAYTNYLKFCAFAGWPGVYFFMEKNGKRMRVKITDAEFDKGEFRVLRVIPEGKREMDYGDFA
jgi:methionyl-tRNA formyltransferase